MERVERAAQRTAYIGKLSLRGRLRGGNVSVVVSIFAGFASFQHTTWIDAQLLHSRDECGAFQSQAAGSAVWSPDAPARFLECLDKFLAIDVGENATDR